MSIEFYEFHQVEHYFFSLMSVAQADYGDMVAFATEVPSSHLNPAFVKKIDEQFLNSLSQCHSFYHQKQLAWSLAIPEYLYQSALENQLQSLNLVQAEHGVAMEAIISEMVFPNSESSLVIKELSGDLSV